jgi:hypothetical protein
MHAHTSADGEKRGSTDPFFCLNETIDLMDLRELSVVKFDFNDEIRA